MNSTEKSHPLFSQQHPSKIWGPVKPPSHFEHLVGGSTPQQKKGSHYGKVSACAWRGYNFFDILTSKKLYFFVCHIHPNNFWTTDRPKHHWNKIFKRQNIYSHVYSCTYPSPSLDHSNGVPNCFDLEELFWVSLKFFQLFHLQLYEKIIVICQSCFSHCRILLQWNI